MWFGVHSENSIEFKQNLGCLFLASSILAFLIVLSFPFVSSIWKGCWLSVGVCSHSQKRENLLCVVCLHQVLTPFQNNACYWLVSRTLKYKLLVFLSRVYSCYLLEDQVTRFLFFYIRSKTPIHFIIIYFLLYPSS